VGRQVYEFCSFGSLTTSYETWLQLLKNFSNQFTATMTTTCLARLQ